MDQKHADPNKPGQVATFLLFLFFFFVIAAFWTLKPLRTSAVVKTLGIDYYPVVKQGLVLIVPLIVGFYSLLACRLSRAALVYFFAALFLVANVIYWLLLSHYPSPIVQLAFYFHVDAYITVMVTLFWTYLNDLYKEPGARKIYGIVGTGGLIGGVAGTMVSGWVSEILGTDIVLVAAIFMVPPFAIVFLLEQGNVPPAEGPAAGSVVCGSTGLPKSYLKQLSEGMTAVLHSKYMLAIVVVVGVYEVLSTILDFQFTDVASATFESRDAMAAFQGKVFFVGQVASIAVQLFLTTYIHRKFGAVHGLFFLPLALSLGSVAFLVLPSLAVISATIGGEAAFGYSINQASKEILYVPLDPVSKVKGKAFIDMFVLRASKTIGALILLSYVFVLKAAGVGSWFLTAVMVAGVMIWLLAVGYIGRTVKKRSNAHD